MTTTKTGGWASSVDAADWEPYAPGGGDPIGEVHMLREAEVDGRPFAAGLWRIDPDDVPEEIAYTLPVNESLHVLRGSVEIDVGGPEPLRLEPGDIATLAEGTETVWRIKAPFLKFYVHS